MSADSSSLPPGAGRPASAVAGKLDTAREHLVAARLALLDAELYLVVQDTARASIQMDLAQAYTSEARKQLPPIGASSK